MTRAPGAIALPVIVPLVAVGVTWAAAWYLDTPPGPASGLVLTVATAITAGFGLAAAVAAWQARRLLATQGRLEIAIAQAGDGVILVGADGRVLLVTRRAATLLGLPEPRRDAGTTWRALSPALPTSIREAGPSPAPGGESLRGADTLLVPGLWHCTGAGGTPLEVRSQVLPDRRVVLRVSDISDRRRGDAALEAAREAAEAANHARAAFLAMMGHELRTPMNGVIGVTSLLRETRLDTEQARLTGSLQQSAEALLRIIDDILTFAKLEVDEIALENAAFAPAALLRALIDSFTPAAQAKALVLTWTAAGPVPTHVMGDVVRLRQVLAVLLDNALKFTEAGAVSVEMTVSGGGEGQPRLAFAVADTGIGIAAEAQADLFREFWQADLRKSRRFGGAGLGLAIARGLIERMGGRISVDSAPGRGSTFRFFIPLRPARDDAPPGVARPAGTPATLKVLLAEDNLTNQLVTEGLLQRLGHQVDVVGDGRAAVTAVAARRYDLVLMDMMMPGVDGLAATRMIRALPDPAAAAVPILALTANAFAQDRALCLEAGMNGHLGKPVRLDDLREAIAGVLTRVTPAARPGSAATAAIPMPAAFDAAVLAQLGDEIGPDAATAVMAEFLRDAQVRLRRMAEAADAADHVAVSREAHTLKSAAGAVGFIAAAAFGDALQRDAAGMDRAALVRASHGLAERIAAGQRAVAASQA